MTTLEGDTMKAEPVTITSRNPFVGISMLILTILSVIGPPSQAALTYFGSVTDLDGNPWPGSGHVAVGYAADGSMYLDGSTSIVLYDTYIAYGEGVDGSFAMSGSGCSLEFTANLLVGNGINSSGRVTFRNGARMIQPTYQNHHIILGLGVGSSGEMVLTGYGTKIRLSDNLYCGHLTGAKGWMEVKDGAVWESAGIHIGYQADAEGEVVVKGSGSILRQWTNGRAEIGRSGHGSLIVKDGALADLRDLRVADVESSYGEVLVTGAGSRLENHYSATQFARGASGVPDPEPATAIIRLARGGVLYTHSDLYVGGTATSSTGTLVFTIGNNGSGSIVPGHAEVDGVLNLYLSHLQMEVDPGVALTLGQQFTLIDYQSFNSSYTFENVSEGGVILTPNHYAFRINYATDLGSGDLAITATVVAPPVADGDGDELLDAWEILCFGSTNNPIGDPDLDPDGDGRNNICEHVAGTDPLDPEAYCFIGMSDVPANTPWELFYTPYEAAVTYDIERAAELTTTNPASPWNPVIPVSNTVSGSEILFTIPGSSSDNAFYRVRISR
ncbi:hypothetical protein [Pontiella agarivorans]|uniref:Uncharacterized protein n=1 Tax=Pontiella agarivorans TaxID=3038953 RepID=A0ABU5MY78_9BACT|nr:hypothetical protein [Pontiella agarivorans]MDZ8119026.1 hypothetical protein [Pontiella agarivorans]